MASIGVAELIILALIVVMFVVVGLVLSRVLRATTGPAAGLVACRACRRPISPRAPSCPHCGDPRVPMQG